MSAPNLRPARRYVIIGAGAIGALLAAQLETVGLRALLVARGANLAAIQHHGGVTVRRPHSTDLVPVQAVGGPSELRLTSGDVLVLATKTQDSEEVLREWAWQPVRSEEPKIEDGETPVVAADLPILTFQNGLATEDLALRRFRRVYAVTIGVAASYLVPGEVVSPSYPTIGIAWLGRYPDRHDEAQDGFVDDLRRAGYQIESVPDISAWKARKLLANLGNGLGVLSGAPEALAAARQALLDEALAVYAAAGIPVPVDQDGQPVGFGAGLSIEPVPGHVAGHASTWQSFARGASSEVDYLNGEIVRIGRLHGVDTPVNERLQRLLGAQAVAGTEPGAHDVTELLAGTEAGVGAA